MEKPVEPAALVAFWREAGPERWFSQDEALDAAIRRRFLGAHEAAARGELDAWTADASGALALVLLLDQFPRNLFRGTARAYATDARALGTAERALRQGHDALVEPGLRQFFYLPLMHAEDLAAQTRSLALYEALGDPLALGFAQHHHAIIERFGRFPHRNAALGRVSTPEEERLLREDAFRG